MTFHLHHSMILFFFGILLYVLIGALVTRLLREEIGVDYIESAMLCTIFWPIVVIFWFMWRVLRALGWKK